MHRTLAWFGPAAALSANGAAFAAAPDPPPPGEYVLRKVVYQNDCGGADIVLRGVAEIARLRGRDYV